MRTRADAGSPARARRKGVLLGSRTLRNAGHARLSIAVLLLLAIPGLLAVLFMILVITTNPRWN